LKNSLSINYLIKMIQQMNHLIQASKWKSTGSDQTAVGMRVREVFISKEERGMKSEDGKRADNRLGFRGKQGKPSMEKKVPPLS
jgi:hypothetical protein